MELIPLVLIVLVFWLVLIRPQQKQRKRMQQLQSSLEPGQRVVTNSGLFGTIHSFDDRGRVVLEVADGVRITMAREAIVGHEQPAPEDDEIDEMDEVDGTDATGTDSADDRRDNG